MSVQPPVCKLCAPHRHWTTEDHVYPKPTAALDAKFEVGDKVGVTQPAPPATSQNTDANSVTSKRGRKPLGRKPMSDAERKRKQRQSQARSAIPKWVKDAVAQRSGGRCEIRGPHCRSTGEEFAHLYHKGMGGSSAPDRDDPNAIRHACKPCHMAEDHNIQVKSVWGEEV